MTTEIIEKKRKYPDGIVMSKEDLDELHLRYENAAAPYLSDAYNRIFARMRGRFFERVAVRNGLYTDNVMSQVWSENYEGSHWTPMVKRELNVLQDLDDLVQEMVCNTTSFMDEKYLYNEETKTKINILRKIGKWMRDSNKDNHQAWVIVDPELHKKRMVDHLEEYTQHIVANPNRLNDLVDFFIKNREMKYSLKKNTFY